MKTTYKENFLKKFRSLLKPQKFTIEFNIYKQVYLDKTLAIKDYKTIEFSSIEPGILSEFISIERN